MVKTKKKRQLKVSLVGYSIIPAFLIFFFFKIFPIRFLMNELSCTKTNKRYEQKQQEEKK